MQKHVNSNLSMCRSANINRCSGNVDGNVIVYDRHLLVKDSPYTHTYTDVSEAIITQNDDVCCVTKCLGAKTVSSCSSPKLILYYKTGCDAGEEKKSIRIG